ncbi:hypothetical protein BACCIP111895_01324 [Neobacillus rhizosphaerae]|uniref:Uncharacterized protein n=1 Tax=Neobacillus rhizosphaerae TaxID=2880965 RepID=A0ABM9EPU5_9BACI|nr:hypothetical protein [Neobacillus rhizosphaerae]CAH2714170.1 hypothetical protein BACCIP111895_01324 [Neobacillus rhizosphaerae]
MKNNMDETSEGLNQIFEIINAKGDEGELKEIVEKERTSTNKKQADISE